MRSGRFVRLGVASIAVVTGLVTGTAGVSIAAPGTAVPAAAVSAAAVSAAAAPAAAVPKPVVSRLSVVSGPTAGGTRVTVTGRYFTRVIRVVFGSSTGNSLKVLSGTELVVTAPKHGPGRVDIRVVTASGTSAVTASDRFSYIAPPQITKVSPVQGSTEGGTLVTITGSNFIRVTKVTFGSAKATIVKTLSSKVLLVRTPAGTLGQVGIRVNTAYGISAVVTADRYRYILPKEALTWTGPLHVDGSGAGFVNGAGCLTATDCFAFDAAGKAVTWNGATWSAPAPALPGPAVADYNGLTSCPSATSCVTVDFDGDTWIYSGGRWTRSGLAPQGLTSVSCPSSTFCMATRGLGDYTQFNGTTWTTPAHLPGAVVSTTVSCVSRSFCLLVAGVGVYTWTGSRWTGPVTISSVTVSVACVSTTWCIAIDSNGEVYRFNGASWSDTGTTDKDPSTLDSPSKIVCTSTTFCLAVDQFGEIMLYNGATWTESEPISTDSAVFYVDAACSGQTCVEVVGGQQNFGASYTGGQWGAPQPLEDDGELDAVSCAPDGFCAAVGYSRDAVTEHNGTWDTAVTLPGADLPGSVSCASAQFCMADDANGDMWRYDGANWTPAPAPAGFHGGTEGDLSCASATFCVWAGSAPGDGISIYNGSTWTKPADSQNDNPWGMVSCPSPTFCVAGGYQSGDVATYNGKTWSALVPVDGNYNGIHALSCASRTFCLLLGFNGALFAFNGSKWSPMRNPSPTASPIVLHTLSCTSSTFCAGVDWNGNAYTWDGRQWSAPAAAAPRGPGSDLSCSSPAYCVLVDGSYALGVVYTGR